MMGTYDSGGSNLYIMKYDDNSSSLFQMGNLWDFDTIFKVEKGSFSRILSVVTTIKKEAVGGTTASFLVVDIIVCGVKKYPLKGGCQALMCLAFIMKKFYLVTSITL